MLLLELGLMQLKGKKASLGPAVWWLTAVSKKAAEIHRPKCKSASKSAELVAIAI